MNTKIQSLLMALMNFSAIHHAVAQGTAFTYQGQLIQGTNLATGSYDMAFSLYAANAGGHSFAGPVTNLAVTVANGLFTVPVDFGADVFNGGSCWLGIDVRTNGGEGFATLAPRTLVTPTPYAIYSQTGGSATNFTGPVSGDISGTQDALVVTTVGGQTAASIAQGVVAANNATPFSVPNSIVGRDTNGNISANALTLGGALNLPFPAILRSGGTNFMIEEGSLYMGFQNSAFVTNLTPLGNTGFGDYALACEVTNLNASGFWNTAMGEYALSSNTNGSDNTAVGEYALSQNTSGDNNTALGVDALAVNVNGGNNTAIGTAALTFNVTGSYNTAIGASALQSSDTSTANTAIGYEALAFNYYGNQNTASGCSALYNNKDGNNDTASGYEALYNNDGENNTASGYEALYNNDLGFNNTGDGYMALYNNVNGTNNIAIGSGAGATLGAGNNNIYIGNAGNHNESGAIRIGTEGTQTTTVIAGIFNGVVPGGEGAIPVYVDSAGHLGPMPSSAQFKRDIQPMGDVSDVLLKLQPVTFKYKESRDPTGTPQFGLVAEEVNKVDPELVVRDANHQIYSVRYEAVNAMLLNEFLKEHQTVEDLKARLEKMERIVSDESAK